MHSPQFFRFFHTLLAGLVFLLVGCAKQSEPTPSASVKGATPEPPAAATKVKLIGSGASFPAPIYDRWFKEFTKKDELITVDYQSVGSGQGVKAFVAGHTDFGASDAAMTDEEIKQAKDNVLLLPMTAGSIVLAYNLEGVTDLKLSRDAYTGIFLGTIKKWNDPKIKAANPDAKLPDLPIAVVHRSDGSGTTFVVDEETAVPPGTRVKA